MVLEEGDKTEAALRLVIDDRDLPVRFQIFFQIAEIVRRLRQMMEHIPGEDKVETGFRQFHLAPRSQDRDDIIKLFVRRLAPYKIQILLLHVDRVDPAGLSCFPGKGERKIAASGTDVGNDIALDRKSVV